jgi:hypothetical protein
MTSKKRGPKTAAEWKEYRKNLAPKRPRVQMKSGFLRPLEVVVILREVEPAGSHCLVIIDTFVQGADDRIIEVVQLHATAGQTLRLNCGRWILREHDKIVATWVPCNGGDGYLEFGGHLLAEDVQPATSR